MSDSPVSTVQTRPSTVDGYVIRCGEPPAEERAAERVKMSDVPWTELRAGECLFVPVEVAFPGLVAVWALRMKAATGRAFTTHARVDGSWIMRRA